MTDAQLYLTLGVPMVFNGVLFTILMIYINGKFSDARDVWVARLKHLEERLG